MERPVLSADAVVDAPPEQVREWFYSLKEHPERYQFDTHEGFEFVEGSFGELGARFRTREDFLWLNLELLFEITRMDEASFSFRLLRPLSMEIWGEFRLEEAGEAKTHLFLEIGSQTRAGRLILRFYPVTAAIQRQIDDEVSHIKTSIEGMPAT